MQCIVTRQLRANLSLFANSPALGPRAARAASLRFEMHVHVSFCLRALKRRAPLGSHRVAFQNHRYLDVSAAPPADPQKS
jgi:hypothetical protein